jgi:DNA invertase Pin-like site-specific DNA recombinase
MTRVAAYCRVSTDNADQIHSFHSQRLFFLQYTENKPDWVLTEIYTDEGITGTTTSERAGFLKMINDAYLGKFDIIITKEVSRFSRNILDAISYTRRLKEIGVGVLFLNDGISTLESDSELRLGIMASVAQEESRRTSERVRWGQTRQMERGVVFGRSLLGYNVVNGRIYIEPEGAKTVRRIFDMYIRERMGVRAIAKALTDDRVPTKSGGVLWSGAAVLKIIRNEKYCGDLLQKKTVTTDYLTHKKRKNQCDDMIYIKDHHEPIISRTDWENAQAQRMKRSCHVKRTGSCGNRYALSGKVFCSGCGGLFYCRTRRRKDGSAYRVWNCLHCQCIGSRRKKRGYFREETLAGCVQNILKSYRGLLLNGLNSVIEQLFKTRDCRIREYENKIILIKEKLLKLLDVYLSGDIGREEYSSLKQKYEARLDDYGVSLSGLRVPASGANAAEAMRIAESLARGDADDTDFYLSLVERIDVISDSEIEIFLINSAGKWTVEIA